MSTKYIFIGIIALLVIIGGTWLYQQQNTDTYVAPTPDTTSETDMDANDPELDQIDDNMTDDLDSVQERGDESTIGTSAGGTSLTAYHFGSGETELLFVGGMHGGYSWNTSLVAFELIDYLEENPSVIPEDVTVTVIPVLNPDGLEKVTGTTGRFTASQVSANEATRVTGRFNDNTVDINRNFDCEWQPEGTWQQRTVSGGTAAFSEPEAQAIRQYVSTYTPSAVVVWYSAAGGVYASNCLNGVLPETTTLTNLYAKASTYPAYESFDYYEITGDMVNWLAKQNIPAISVLLTNHQNTEWNKNKAGIDAMLNYYSE